MRSISKFGVASLSVSVIAILCATAATMAGVAALAPPASAGYLQFCHEVLVDIDEECGIGEWEHMEHSEAHDGAEGRLCTDGYMDPNGSPYYTPAGCGPGSAYQYYEKVWGYPRAWNSAGFPFYMSASEWW